MALNSYERHRIYGVVLGLVTNNQDPKDMGRVKVRFHMFDKKIESDWCRVASLFAGKERGALFLPEVEDEVVIAFEHGDVNFPFVIGSVWNGKDAPPKKKNKDNNLKILRSRAGHEITFDDTKGNENLTIKDSSTKNTIEIDVKNKRILIESAEGDISIRAPKGTLTMECKDLAIKASGKADLEAKGALTFATQKDLSLSAKGKGTLSIQNNLKVESKGGEIALKASTAFKADCSSLAIKTSGKGDLKATGVLTIKGQKVFIN